MNVMLFTNKLTLMNKILKFELYKPIKWRYCQFSFFETEINNLHTKESTLILILTRFFSKKFQKII
jgi:hypothetical protein